MITKTGAVKALAKRRAAEAKPIELRADFPLQNAFVTDTSRFIAAQCGRRSGKTNGLALRFFQTLAKYPGSQCVYLALTRDSARDIMWPILMELNEKHKLGCTFTPSSLTMVHPNKAQLKLYGADMSNFIKRLKGRKFPGVAIDEAQDMGVHLQSLIDDVLTPSIADYEDGWLALVGTPGPVPSGTFFDITQANKFGYSVHRWSITDNPFLPNAKEFIEELKQRREWPDDHPTLLREYKNKWVLDVQALWIRYNEKVNHYDSLPKLSGSNRWNYVLGIDLGFNDADALAVLAWSNESPNLYLIEELITKKQGLTELVEQIQAMTAKYSIAKMVIDEGGLGKKMAEEMRRRHRIPVQPADKHRKQETVEFLNDALRLGRVKARKDSRFALDSYLVQIDWDKSTPDRIVVKKKPHSDIIDAVLYAFKESPAYTYQSPAKVPEKGTKEYNDMVQDKMFEAAKAHFEEQAELERRWNPWEQE